LSFQKVPPLNAPAVGSFLKAMLGLTFLSPLMAIDRFAR
jgi:hypothetical protein